MPAQPVRAVIFDLGGVLIDWDPRYLYRKLFDDEGEMEHFLATVCTPAWNELQDGGRSLAEGTAALTSRWPRYAAQIEAFYGRWSEMLRGEVAGSVAVLAELRERGVPLYALTNWSAETFPIARERYAFLRWFEGIVVSGEEGVRKPEPAIFRLLLERYGLTASASLFVDDSTRNVEAAARLGFVARHFRTSARLRRDLEEHGLL